MMKTMKQLTILAALLGISISSMAQMPVPAEDQKQSILIVNGTAHLGNGQVIEQAAIGFKDGKITYAGSAAGANKSDYQQVIDASNKHIYPGFISPNSTLGLAEVDAVRATRDVREVGEYKPHVRAIIAYNTDSKITPTAKQNGVLMAQITPRGGTISGASSVVELDAWNWEDAAYKMDDGIHLRWPRMFMGGWWSTSVQKSKSYKSYVEDIRTFFTEAKAYHEIPHQEVDLRFEAMKGLFSGEQTLFVHANYVKEIIELINFTQNMGIPKVVLVGGADSWMVTDMLREKKVSVILGRVHDLPQRQDDDIDLPFKLPYLLHKEGVLFCLDNSGDMERAATRNLPFMAGTAATYGLSKEEALMAITGNTAKILGIDGTVGTLESGKDATLFISTGDALDMRTNQVEKAFIRGKDIDLNNTQIELYERYKKKYANQ